MSHIASYILEPCTRSKISPHRLAAVPAAYFGGDSLSRLLQEWYAAPSTRRIAADDVRMQRTATVGSTSRNMLVFPTKDFFCVKIVSLSEVIRLQKKIPQMSMCAHPRSAHGHGEKKYVRSINTRRKKLTLKVLPKDMSTRTQRVDDHVIHSAKVSLGAQLILGLISAAAIVVPTKGDEHLVCGDIYNTGDGAQAIEFVYYLLVVFYYRGIRTWTRYLDWTFSTPTMLVSSMTFFLYLDRSRRGETTSIADVFRGSNLAYSAAVLALNQCMLVCGLLVELGYASKFVGDDRIALFHRIVLHTVQRLCR